MKTTKLKELREHALETYKEMSKVSCMHNSFIIECIQKHEPEGFIIEKFLQWGIENDLIFFDKLLYSPEDINVTMDIAEKLIIKYLTEG